MRFAERSAPLKKRTHLGDGAWIGIRRKWIACVERLANCSGLCWQAGCLKNATRVHTPEEQQRTNAVEWRRARIASSN